MAHKDDAGLTVYPHPNQLRATPFALTPRLPGTPKPDMREEFETCLELASATMTVEDLAASADFSLAQKGIIFQKILAKQSAPPAGKDLQEQLGTPPPPVSHNQEMLAPLSSASADSGQMIKNRESARALEQSHASAPLLGSAMEAAARSLSTSGSLPPNATALPHGSAPPPAPPSLPIRFAVPYLVQKVPDKIAVAFSREHDVHAKNYPCVFNGYEGQPICSSEAGAWQKYINPGNQSCYFQAKVSNYPDARAAYNDCLGWLLKMRVIHASQLSEFSCSQCFNTHRGTPDDPTYCPAPAVDWTPRLGARDGPSAVPAEERLQGNGVSV